MLFGEVYLLEQMLSEGDKELSRALSGKEAAHTQLLHVLSAYVERRESHNQHTLPEVSSHSSREPRYQRIAPDPVDSAETQAQIVARASVVDAWPISVHSC